MQARWFWLESSRVGAVIVRSANDGSSFQLKLVTWPLPSEWNTANNSLEVNNSKETVIIELVITIKYHNNAILIMIPWYDWLRWLMMIEALHGNKAIFIFQDFWTVASEFSENYLLKC